MPGDTTIVYNPSTTDYGPAIQAAIATANSAGGGTVSIPSGTYPVLTTINFQSGTGVTIQGAGLGTTLACQMASPNAGGIVASSTTRCAIRDLRMTGAGTTTTLNGLIFAQAATQLTVDSVRFENGGSHLSLNGCTYCTVSNTSHNGLTIPSQVLVLYQCKWCSLINPIVSGFAFPSQIGGTPRVIILNDCTDVNVNGGSITNVDLSPTGGGAGFSFFNSNHCTLTGFTVSGLGSADGIEVSTGCSYIAISNCDSSNNSQNTGTGSPVGDGFDIFHSSYIRISNCIAYSNGTNGAHPGFEIVTCNDVSITNCLSQSNNSHGFLIEASTDVLLSGCSAIDNGDSGVYATSGSGVQTQDLRIIGGDCSSNNRNGTTDPTMPWRESGIVLYDATTAWIVGTRASEPNSASPEQRYGIYVNNTSTATIIGCHTASNAVDNIFVYSMATAKPIAGDTNLGTVIVSGSKDGNVALASLVSALAGLNIIHDGTS